MRLLATGWALLALLLAGCAAPGGPGPTDASGQLPAPALAWTSHAPGPTPRSEVAAGVLDARIHVVGGFLEDGSTTGRVEVYDAAADTWSRAPDYPLSIHHAAVVGDRGTLYVFGGATTPAFVPTNLAFKLEPGALAWTPLPPLPRARYAHTGAVVDGKVYLVGGIAPDRALLKTVDVFDIASNAWTTAPDVPTGRDHTTAVALDGRVLVLGGDQLSHDALLTTVEALDPRTGRWTSLAPLPLAKGAHGAAVVGGKVLVAGGEDNNRTFPETFAYDPATDTWSTLPPIPTPRHGFGAAAWGDRFYALLGGPQTGLSVTASVESLGPAGAGRGITVR